MESVTLINLQSHFHIILRVVFLFGIFYGIEVTPILSVQQPDPYVRIKFIAAICRGTMHHRNINFILCTRQRRQREIEKLKFAYIKFPNQGVAFFVFLRSKGFRYVRKVVGFFHCSSPSVTICSFLVFCNFILPQVSDISTKNASHGETHLYVVFVRRNQTRHSQNVFNQVLRLFISFAIIIIACFCDGVNVTHCSIRGFKSGVNSIISPSAKNCESVMPKPAQRDSNVEIDGVALRFRMFAIVDSDSPHSFESRYALQPRFCMSWSSFW